MSLDSFVTGFFLDFDACFRNNTAANDRAYPVVRHIASVASGSSYRGVLRSMHLLHKTHEQDIWAIDHPVIGEMLLGLRAYIVVRRREGGEKLTKGRLDLSRELRHGSRPQSEVIRGGSMLGAPAFVGSTDAESQFPRAESFTKHTLRYQDINGEVAQRFRRGTGEVSRVGCQM